MSKEQALQKMLQEMEQEHTSAEDAIHNWLCEQTGDAELMAGICKDGKTIKQAMKYCMQEAKKQSSGGSAMVDDATVFKWVRTYFVSDEIEVEHVSGSVQTSIEPEKPTKPKSPAKPKVVTEPKEKKKEHEQMSLFDFSE
ncbi:PcfK-like family protein [Aerococcaceae bacterium NML191219]|nr:PcfK-like family protein [Aerococcaceae bacterium NML191219]